MTIGIIAARIAAGLLLGAASLALPWVRESVEHFSIWAWAMAVPISAGLAAANVSIDGKHCQWWRTCHDGSAARYITMSALTGALPIALAAYPGMLLGMLLFMAA
jgi:hypothetical protein